MRAENLSYTYVDDMGVTCNVYKRSTPYVRVQISPDDNKFPYYVERKKGSGYLSYLLLSKHEALIEVLAHELRHVWQDENKGKRRGKVWGTRGDSSDRDADYWGIQMVRKYRRLYNHKEAYPPLFFVIYDIILSKADTKRLELLQACANLNSWLKHKHRNVSLLTLNKVRRLEAMIQIRKRLVDGESHDSIQQALGLNRRTYFRLAKRVFSEDVSALLKQNSEQVVQSLAIMLQRNDEVYRILKGIAQNEKVSGEHRIEACREMIHVSRGAVEIFKSSPGVPFAFKKFLDGMKQQQQQLHLPLQRYDDITSRPHLPPTAVCEEEKFPSEHIFNPNDPSPYTNTSILSAEEQQQQLQQEEER